MSRQQKIAIALLAVVAGLFAVAVAVGLGGGEAGYSAGEGDWVSLFDGLVEKRSFGIRDTRGCRLGDAFLLDPGERCTVTIPPAEAPVRSARLVLDEGREAVAALSQPGSVTQREVLKAGEEVTLKVFKSPAKRPEEGARLELRCRAGGTGGDRCVLRLRKP